MFILSIIVTAIVLIKKISTTSILSEAIDYKNFRSEIYPDYGVRYISPTLCDPNVTQYAGYFDMGANHYHFWFFESKQDPANSPVTAWINGGPGCTTQIGVWLDNGPCFTGEDGKTIEFRKDTWTYFSNMLYIDQPSGTGYSYGDTFNSLNQSTPLYYDALQLFYEAFPKYSKLPLHIFGESFGGRMAPLIASYIIDQNLKIEDTPIVGGNCSLPKQIVPLRSVGLGNGWTDPQTQLPSLMKMACNSPYDLPIPEEICRKIELLYEACLPLILECADPTDEILCGKIDLYCSGTFFELLDYSGRDKFDVRRSNTLPHGGEGYLIMLNRPEFQKAVGAKLKKNVQLCERDRVTSSMIKSGEDLKTTVPQVEHVLNHDIPVLVYAGDADFAANWYGQMEYMSKLKFNGSEEYNRSELKPWVVQGEEFGQSKSTEKLTFLRVYGAGHEVAFSAPKKAIKMFETWIKNKSF